MHKTHTTASTFVAVDSIIPSESNDTPTPNKQRLCGEDFGVTDVLSISSGVVCMCFVLLTMCLCSVWYIL
jgi:hypothetical protein